MDAAELKVLLDELHKVTDERIIRITNNGFENVRRAREELCQQKGGHEYVSKGPGGASYKECKHCGHQVHD